MFVLSCITPVTPKDIKRAVKRAQAVCSKSPETPECRVMWDHVNDLTIALDRQRDKEIENRLYDV
jgi:hypothetical protein